MNAIKKPTPKSMEGAKSLDKIERNLDKQNEQLKEIAAESISLEPTLNHEPSHQKSQKELQASKDIYLTPKRTIFAVDRNTGKAQKFNEDFRKDYEFDKEFVHFIAEHKEMQGESIETWTRPYGGMPAEYWIVPTDKPVWGPRYLAEQIKRKFYNRLVMKEKVITEENSYGQMTGALSVKTEVPRLNAYPVTSRKSIFMGSTGF